MNTKALERVMVYSNTKNRNMFVYLAQLLLGIFFNICQCKNFIINANTSQFSWKIFIF